MSDDARKKLIDDNFKRMEKKTREFHQNPGNSPSHFHKIMELMLKEAHLDLTNYRENYLYRRFTRRMGTVNVDTYQDYIQYLRENPDEFELLKADLTIHTTEFFRDQSPFDLLKQKLIPLIGELKKKTKDPVIRILSAPSSSGQEPYSIAMLIDELRKEGIRYPFEIWGTDIDKDTIEKAKEGIFIQNAMKGISEERLHNYFTQISEDTYQIKSEIRSMVKFFEHDLFKPLPRWLKTQDLILCRNLLIYISRERQIQVLRNLQAFLVDNGYMMLGKTESLLIVNQDTDFVAYNPREHVYQYFPK